MKQHKEVKGTQQLNYSQYFTSMLLMCYSKHLKFLTDLTGEMKGNWMWKHLEHQQIVVGSDVDVVGEDSGEEDLGVVVVQLVLGQLKHKLQLKLKLVCVTFDVS